MIDWLEEVQSRLKRKNQILFSKNSAYLTDLNELISAQSHRAVVLWAFEVASEAVNTLLKAYPGETRPQKLF